MSNVKFKYGTWENYKCLLDSHNTDEGTLYFLDNSQIYKGDQLMQTVKAQWGEFPEEPGADMRNNFFISMETGEVRYVDEDLNYINVTELVLDNLLVNEEFLERLINAIAEETNIILPTLTVDGSKLVWSGSNYEQVTVFTPKNKNN